MIEGSHALRGAPLSYVSPRFEPATADREARRQGRTVRRSRPTPSPDSGPARLPEIGARSGHRPPAAPSGRPDVRGVSRSSRDPAAPSPRRLVKVPSPVILFRAPEPSSLTSGALQPASSRHTRGIPTAPRLARFWPSYPASHRVADVSQRCSEQSRRKAATQSHGAVAILRSPGWPGRQRSLNWFSDEPAGHACDKKGPSSARGRTGPSRVTPNGPASVGRFAGAPA
jgi:hypothetical protein